MLQSHFIKLVTNFCFKNSSRHVRKAAYHKKKIYLTIIVDNHLNVKYQN